MNFLTFIFTEKQLVKGETSLNYFNKNWVSHVVAYETLFQWMLRKKIWLHYLRSCFLTFQWFSNKLCNCNNYRKTSGQRWNFFFELLCQNLSLPSCSLWNFLPVKVTEKSIVTWFKDLFLGFSMVLKRTF